MKTVTNKTRRPLRLPLPGGKALFLGPMKTGQIRDDAPEHAALKKMIESGEIEIAEAGARDNEVIGTAPHQTTHSQGRSTLRQKTGDR